MTPPPTSVRPDTALPTGGAGNPLAAGLRGRLEPLLGADLSDVRVHDTAADRDLAASFAARAVTHRNHIWLGPRGQRDDISLLAHEAAHVVQQRRGATGVEAVQRFPEDASFAPETVGLEAMTNVALLQEAEQVRRFKAGHGDEDPASGMVTRLGERIEAERARRIGLGHLWLAEASEPKSIPLFAVWPGPKGVAVAVPPAAVVEGVPTDRGASPIFTAAQFSALLREQQIPVMSVATYLGLTERERIGDNPAPTQSSTTQGIEGSGMAATGGVTGGRTYRVGLWPDVRMNDAFTARPGPGWIGGPGEAAFFGSRPYGSLIDTNTLEWTLPNGQPWRGPSRSYPIVDAATPDWLQLYNVKTSGDPSPAVRLQRYAGEIGDDLTAQQLQSLLSRNVPGTPSRQQLFDRLRPVLPAGDAAPFQAALQNPAQRLDPTKPRTKPVWELAPFRSIYDNILQIHPETVPTVAGGKETFNSIASMRAAQQKGTITEPEFFNALSRAGGRLASQTLPNVISSAEAVQMRGQRAALGSGRASVSATRTFDFTEYLAAQRMGPTRAMAVSGVTGGAMGGLIAVTVGGVTMWVDEREHPNWARELGVSGATGVAGGTAGAATQQAVANRLGQYLVRRGVALGLGGALGARGLAGGAGGGVGGIAAEGLQILLEDRPHSPREVALRGGRAFVIGAATGVLATIASGAVTGLVAGSVAPGVGNVIGFVVGLGVGIGMAIALERAIPRPAPTP